MTDGASVIKYGSRPLLDYRHTQNMSEDAL